MAKVGSLIVDIAANTTKLVSGMEKAQRSVNNFTKSMKTTLKVATSAFAAFKSVDTIIQTLRDSAKLGSEISASASQLGASAEYYQTIAKVFEEVGSSGQTATDGIKQFNKILGDIRSGGGSSSKKLLDSLGLDAADLSLMKVNERMDVTLQKIGQLSNQTDRARATAQLFGEFTGRVFTGLLEDVEGYNRAMQEAARFVIPDVQIAALTKLDKGFNDVKKAWEKLKASFSSSAIGAIGNAWNKLITDILLGLADSQSSMNRFVQHLSGVANTMLGLFGMMKSGYLQLVEVIKIFVNKAGILAIKFAQAWEKAILSVKGAIRQMAADVYVALDGNTIFQPVADSARDMMVSINSSMSSNQNSVDSFSASIKGMNENITASVQKIQELDQTSGFSSLSGKYQEGMDYIKDLTEEYQRTAELAKNGTESMTQTVQDLDNKTKNATKSAKTLKDTWGEFDGLRSTLESGFMGLFDSLMDGTFEWRDAFLQVLKQIMSELIRILVVKQMVSAIGGFFGMGSISGTGVQAFAKGGVVNSPVLFNTGNGPGVMGESGPEAILPLVRTSGGDLGVKSTESKVEVNVYNYGNDDVQVQDNGDSIDIMINKIATDIYRGTGPVPSAMESRYGLMKR